MGETKNCYTSKEFLQFIPTKLTVYATKGTMHWRKLRHLRKKTKRQLWQVQIL